MSARVLTSSAGLTANVKPSVRTPRSIPKGPIAVAVLLGSILILFAIPFKNSADVEPVPITSPSVTKLSNSTNTIWFFNEFDELPDTFMLVLEVHNCTGSNGTVEYREYEGNYLDSFFYHGQADVYLGCNHLTTYNGLELQTDEWHWLGNLTRDYLAGDWTPSDGVEFVHSDNQTFGDAELIILSYTPIPEFSTIGVVIVIFILMAVLIKRRKT